MTSIRVEENVLHCPRCGGNNMHHGDVHIDNRVTEDGPGVRVTVEGGTGSGTARDFLAGGGDAGGPGWGSVAVRAAVGSDFAGRRDDVTISMMCEQCGPVGALVVAQHKGCTLVEWK